jgi:N-acetylmuramoyl-L-alanine amidase
MVVCVLLILGSGVLVATISYQRRIAREEHQRAERVRVATELERQRAEAAAHEADLARRQAEREAQATKQMLQSAASSPQLPMPLRGTGLHENGGAGSPGRLSPTPFIHLPNIQSHSSDSTDTLNREMDLVSRQLLTQADLYQKSAWELTLMRNAPYARRGYRFHDVRLLNYFATKRWYRPVTGDMDAISRTMTRIEQINCKTILDFQNAHKLRTTGYNLELHAGSEVAQMGIEAPVYIDSGRTNPLAIFYVDGQSELMQSECVSSNNDIPTVCIDPGHSRVTVGARGTSALEYRVVWQVAGKLKIMLENSGIHVILTKHSADENVRTEERAAIANRARASLFLRLHCDAGDDEGVATFYPDRQGAVNSARGPEWSVIAASRRKAYLFHPAMLRNLGGALHDRGIRTDAETYVGSRQGGALTGSIRSHVPVLLVEMCVLTNLSDERFISSERGQRRMAQAIAAGVHAAIQTD